MLARRLALPLLALLALAGFSALPATAATSPAPATSQPSVDPDDPIDDETGYDDEDLADDGDLSALDDEEIADDEDFDADSCDFISDEDVADETLAGDDEDVIGDEEILDPSDDDLGDEFDDTSDEDLGDDTGAEDDLCALLEDTGATPDEPGETDTSDLGKSGKLTVDLFVSGPGDVEGALTGGSSGRAVIAAKARVLGRGHKHVAKAGLVTLQVKLTKQGRRLVKKTRKALSLTLGTTVSLDSGRTVKGSTPVTVKPAKKKHKGKGKGKKPKKH
jgi:hypothetical protein